MREKDSSSKSSFVCPAYHSIEEVNEVLQTAGWDGEFRQLAKGRVNGRWQSLHLGPSSLSYHRLDKRIHVRQAPPRGCVALVIVPPPYFLLVDGAEVGKHEAILLNADSEADFVVPKESACETLAVPRSDFEASSRALFPRMHEERTASSRFSVRPVSLVGAAAGNDTPAAGRPDVA